MKYLFLFLFAFGMAVWLQERNYDIQKTDPIEVVQTFETPQFSEFGKSETVETVSREGQTLRAQVDTTGNGTGGGVGGIWAWLKTNYVIVLGIVIAIYTALARYIPSISNYDILGKIINFLALLLPNNKAGGGTHA